MRFQRISAFIDAISAQVESFKSTLHTVSLNICGNCSEHWPIFGVGNKPGAICALCAASAKRRTAFSQINLMHPGAPPSDLPQLSPVEESLIALHCPVLKIVRLKGGQLGYSGNCVAVTQDIGPFVSKLPRNIEDTHLTIVVPFCNATDEAPKSLRVSSLKIKRWLMFLIEHNPLYAGISIDENALTALPSNGNDFQHLLPLICIAAGDDDPAPADGEINVQGIMGDTGEKPEQVLVEK